MDMVAYQSLVATCAVLRRVEGFEYEMEGYELGKVSYVMNLIWSATTCQLFGVGMASSLFSNAINVACLPVIIFHDKMDGIKAMVTQHKANKDTNVASDAKSDAKCANSQGILYTSIGPSPLQSTWPFRDLFHVFISTTLMTQKSNRGEHK
ncbi:hypothetical protein DVH24_011327 [Malus domestica]|uniref:Uncharacterized protein n=1 Tax=Malus domestica TaxID=3750 RepID=A0A498JZU3_MALDO|nr:hypothetical protein DVH24_011327 [Malus domestica]